MKNRFTNLMVICFIAALTTSCSDITQRRISWTTAKLNIVEESQNDWGRIAVSDLDFVSNQGQYSINFNEDVTNYVQSARSNISGDASSSMQSALYAGAMVQGMFAPPISTGSPASSTNLPSPAGMPNQAETAVNNFPQPAFSSGLNPTTDERDAVEKGINDKIAETFLKFMANPSVDSNKEAVVFGVMQATCQPGRYTRSGYVAQLDISLKYARTNTIREYTTNLEIQEVELAQDMDTRQAISIITNRTRLSLASPMTDQVSQRTYYLAGTNSTIEVQQQKRPSILAVLPLMDSRNMELQNSSQKQVEVALALSAAFAAKGMNAAANLLSDYVKRQESNINTRNSLPVTTTYSDGVSFGFQLYPAAQAIENPGKAGSSSGDVLEPVTFPIVVAIKVSRDTVANPNNPWNSLVTETQTRWIPIKWKFLPWLDEKLSVSGYSLWNDVPLYERMRRSREIDHAQANLKLIAPLGARYPQTIPVQYRAQYLQLQTAIDSLSASAISTTLIHPLPPDLFPANTNPPVAVVPAIMDVFPHSIWRDTNTCFTILVKGVLNPGEITNVIIAGIPCPVTNVISYGSTNYTHSITLYTTNFVFTNITVATSGRTNTTGTNYICITTNNDWGVITNFMPEGIAISASLPKTSYSTTNSTTNNVDFVVLLKNQAPATRTVGLTLQGSTAPEAIVTINRDSNGKFLGVDIRPGKDVTDKQLLDAIKEVLQKSETPPKTTTIVP